MFLTLKSGTRSRIYISSMPNFQMVYYWNTCSNLIDVGLFTVDPELWMNLACKDQQYTVNLTTLIISSSSSTMSKAFWPSYNKFTFLLCMELLDMLDELEQLLKGIAMMKELTLRTRDYLVSFGECMSTRIFAAYLNKIGVKARQVLLDISFNHLESVRFAGCEQVPT